MIGLDIGRTGVGKSVLAEYLTRPEICPRAIYCDPKGKMGPVDHIVREFPSDAMKIDWNAPKCRVLWLAPAEWQFFVSLNKITVILDEADKHWQAGAAVDELDSGLVDLIARAREYGVNLFAISQSAAQIPAFVRLNASRVYHLATSDARARAQAFESWGLRPPDLERYVYVYWSDGGKD